MQLLDNLRLVSGTAAKQSLLQGISFNEWRTFTYAYHPDSIYHMKFSKNLMGEGEPSDQMFNLLDDILDGHIRGDRAKEAVERFAKEHGDLIKLVINKDLRCGVTATTFNKVHAGSIPQFSVQLAKEVPLDKVIFPVLAQLKYDGVRLIIKVEGRNAICRTRNGKIVYLPELQQVVESLPFDNYILDGEIVLAHGLQKDRTSVSGMINSAMHGGRIIETGMVFHCFDTMALSQWNECDCPDPYSIRFGILRSIMATVPDSKLQLAVTNEIHTLEAATNLYEGALAMGYEGLVLKYDNHRYTFRRSKDWIKVKEVKHADLVCSAVIAGEGKYENMIGALYCIGEVEGRHVAVHVGSGLTDLQRGMPPSTYKGMVIEVKYNAVIQDSITGQWSLFLPRFERLRLDKSS